MEVIFDNIFVDKIGSSGIAKDIFEAVCTELSKIKSLRAMERSQIGFLAQLNDQFWVEKNKLVLDQFSGKYSAIVVVGIGGSDLGTRAVYQALSHAYKNELQRTNPKVYFAGDTTDPTPLVELFDVIDLKQTLFIIVSKSGETIEPAVSLQVITTKLQKAGISLTDHIVAITGSNGALKEFATKNSLTIVDFPEDVGGRFSVLTSVALFPLSLMGIDVVELRRAASEFAKKIESENSVADVALKYAAAQYLYMRKDYNMTVLMSYVYSFHQFGNWFRQLWSESLGKANQINGEKAYVNVSTPIVAIGPTDQHSQLQLYNDGPNDKLFTFLQAKTSEKDFTIEGDKNEIYFAGLSMQQILGFEQEATAYSLAQNGKPSMTITIDSVTEYSLGELFCFFEYVIIYLGYLLNINVFDQPGVELSKNIIKGLAGDKKFETFATKVTGN